VQRLRYLLYAEGFLHSSGGISQGKPLLCNTRTVRALIELGPSGIPQLLQDCPDLEAWPGWASLQACMRTQQQLRPGDESPFLLEFEHPPEFEEDSPEPGIPQLMERAAYAWLEEWRHRPIAWTDMTPSIAKLLRRASVPALVSRQLNEGRPELRELWMRCLERGYGVEPGSEVDGSWWRSLWQRTQKYPGPIAKASASEFVEFAHEGVISSAFAEAHRPELSARRPWPSAATDLDGPAPCYELADGRFQVRARVPGSRGSSLDLGNDKATGRAVRVTKLFVLESGGEGESGEALIVPPERRMALNYSGVTPLLFRQRVQFAEGAANVMVEALPSGQRGDSLGARAIAEVAELVERTSVVVDRVHRGGELVLGLRPEAVFVTTDNKVELVPRGVLFRRLSWPHGPNVENQVPPFAGLYLPPDLAGKATPEPRSDVFSLCACALYWVLGQAPISGATPVAQLQRLMTAPGSVDLSALPEPLQHACAAALESTPTQRPTLTEFRGAWSHHRK